MAFFPCRQDHRRRTFLFKLPLYQLRPHTPSLSIKKASTDVIATSGHCRRRDLEARRELHHSLAAEPRRRRLLPRVGTGLPQGARNLLQAEPLTLAGRLLTAGEVPFLQGQWCEDWNLGKVFSVN
jgi:hypothetical protein